MTKCNFSEKDRREIKEWAKKFGARFTLKEYNQMLKREKVYIEGKTIIFTF